MTMTSLHQPPPYRNFFHGPMRSVKQLILAVLGTFIAVSPLHAKLRDLESEKVSEAIAQLDAAQSQEKRKVLIFSAVHHFYTHDSIRYGKEVFPLLGEMTGAYEVVVSDDPTFFEKDKLAEFDAVLFNNPTGEPFRGPKEAWKQMSSEEQQAILKREKQLQANLVEFVKSGKGFIGIHSATDTYTSWRDYVEMIGGRFAKHPWTKRKNVVVNVIDPTHTLTKDVFPNNSLSLTEEIYVLKDANGKWLEPSASDRRYLLMLDVEASDPVETPVSFVPVAWIKNYGEGRVFYTSLGHNPAVYENKYVLQHYLRGIQYALGDLPAEAAPKMTP